MQEEQQRRKLVTWALTMTEGTTYAPGDYERQLLEQYVDGTLSIEQVIGLLETPPVGADAAASLADSLAPTSDPIAPPHHVS